MSTLFFILSLLLAVIVANIIFRHFAKVPLPIYLIGLGIVLAIFPIFRNFTFDPSLFILLVIAPLLYDEAQSASRYWIGRGAINIFSLAIMLVVVTVLIVGPVLHGLFSFIPLTLAFALGAIVTPTDAAAVSALAPENPDFKIPLTILKNESLFNDASGIVIFDLSLVAFTTGAFSFRTALTTFAAEFIGGLVIGVIIGLVTRSIFRSLISLADDTPLIIVTLDLIMPFLIYFVAQQLHFSGILAVVAAGLVQGSEQDKLRLTSSRVQLVRANVWEMITGLLSGIVFVLLGVSLPTVIAQILAGQPGLIWLLILAGVVLYVIKFGLRLLWTRYLVWMHISSKHRWRDSWLMAFSGISGTISLSLAFLLPERIHGQPFAARSSLIFIATVVILLSLLLSTILLPKIVKGTASTETNDLKWWTREMIIAGIKAIRNNQEHPAEASIVIDTISQQLTQNHLRHPRQERRILLVANAAEHEAIAKLRKAGKITSAESYYYKRFLDLSLFTVSSNLLKNIFLRIRFGIQTARRRELRVGENMFFTSPLISEQLYW
ncbi:cation:proton antiporter [Loigolactobacillus iwatensis]|uniref:cation:proton antiporter n=1 Tax=Loigolactobacillus iwatensis TaxID=1267156 RepID=UPI001CDD63C1|nr:sodium:proton antiporter [Loigolactobacillus iwatensis]